MTASRNLGTRQIYWILKVRVLALPRMSAKAHSWPMSYGASSGGSFVDTQNIRVRCVRVNVGDYRDNHLS